MYKRQPLREFTYSEDIVKILMFLLENYDEPEPINIGNTEEYSIKQVVEMICSIKLVPDLGIPKTNIGIKLVSIFFSFKILLFKKYKQNYIYYRKRF